MNLIVQSLQGQYLHCQLGQLTVPAFVVVEHRAVFVFGLEKCAELIDALAQQT